MIKKQKELVKNNSKSIWK